MNKILKYSIALTALLAIGIAIYYYIMKKENHLEHSTLNEVYTCSMHPEIIRNKPGNCPICGMKLVKKINKSSDLLDNNIEYLLKPTYNFIVGNYATTTAKDTAISSELDLPGVVSYDANTIVNISARVNGRIEKMYVNYKYQHVSKGQILFELYSPELLTEQENYVFLISNDAENTAIVKASTEKLLLYGMSPGQISKLKTSKKVNPIISIYSPTTGIISGTEKMELPFIDMIKASSNTTEKLNIKEGNYIKKGELVFKLFSTNMVWGIFNISQGNNRFVQVGNGIKIVTELDETILAQVNFIENQLNPAEKTNRIRVYLNNMDQKLPIGLRLQGKITLNPSKGIWIHRQALISVGNEKIVFLKMNKGFMAKSIKVGMEIGDYVLVLGGIAVNDIIAKNAQYLTDSESFIKTE